MSASTKISRLMKPLLTSTSWSKSFRMVMRSSTRLVQFAAAGVLGTKRLVTGNDGDLLVIVPGVFARFRRLHPVQRQIVNDAAVFPDVRGPPEKIHRQLAHLGIDGFGFVASAGLDRLQIVAHRGEGGGLQFGWLAFFDLEEALGERP